MTQLDLEPELELSTGRLHLRPVAEQDAEATAALMTADVAANLTTWPPTMSPQLAMERIKLAEERLAARQAVELAILDRRTQALFGWMSIGILPGSNEGKARIGFWLGRAQQRKGLMFETATAAIPLASRFLSIKSIEACVYPWNKPALKLIRTLGFKPKGTAELFSPVRDRLEDALLFELRL